MVTLPNAATNTRRKGRYAFFSIPRNAFPSQREINESTGFSSSSYFPKLFKKEMGMTPQQYRYSHEDGSG